MRPKELQRPRNDADTLSGCTHAHSDQIDPKMSAKIAETISVPKNSQKQPNSSVGVKNQRIGEADGLGNRADGSSRHRGTQSNGNNLKMAKNASKNVRTRQGRPKSQTNFIGLKLKH